MGLESYNNIVPKLKPKPRAEGTIPVGNNPFNEVEAYYVGARFYKMKSDQEKEKGVAEVEDF